MRRATKALGALRMILLFKYLAASGYDLTPVEVQVPASQEQEEQVTATESNQDPQVSPSRIEADGERLIELVANVVRAVRTVRRRVVSDVSCAAGRKES